MMQTSCLSYVKTEGNEAVSLSTEGKQKTKKRQCIILWPANFFKAEGSDIRLNINL